MSFVSYASKLPRRLIRMAEAVLGRHVCPEPMTFEQLDRQRKAAETETLGSGRCHCPQCRHARQQMAEPSL